MGNNINRPFVVGIKTDQPMYSGGSVISGTIYLAVSTSENLVIPKNMKLTLSLTGKENAVVHYTTTSTDSKGNTTTHSHTDRRTQTIYSVGHCIADFSSSASPVRLRPGGQYEFPFSMHIPDNLPDSFQITRGQDRCSVSYELKAELNGAPSKSIFGVSYPKARMPIGVIAGPAAFPEPDPEQRNLKNVYGNDIFPIMKGCIFDAGSMGMYVKTAENSSTKSVYRIKVKMEEVIRWKANGHSSGKSRVLFRQDLSPEHFPDLVKIGRKPSVQNMVNLKAGVLSGSAEWKHLVDMTIPTDAFLYNGSLISVTHLLTVSLVTKGASMGRPCVSIPCKLNRFYMENSRISPAPSAPFVAAVLIEDDCKEYESQAYEIPQNWSAHTADVVEISFAQAKPIH